MANGVINPESNNRHRNNWQGCLSSLESESMACNESEDVNAGDPIDSCRKRVSMNKCKSEDAETVNRKSDRT